MSVRAHDCSVRLELTGVFGKTRSNGDLQDLPTGLQYGLIALTHLKLDLSGPCRAERTPAALLHFKLQSRGQMDTITRIRSF